MSGNKKDIVERLRSKPNRPMVKIYIGNGTEINVPGLLYNAEDDELRKEAADYIEYLRKKGH